MFSDPQQDDPSVAWLEEEDLVKNISNQNYFSPLSDQLN